MRWHVRGSIVAFIVSMLLLCVNAGHACGQQPAKTPSVSSIQSSRTITVYTSRQAETDLAVSGLIMGLSAGTTGYVRHRDIALLPHVTTAVHGDDNFNTAVRVTGVYLDVLAKALGAYRDADLIDATCTDDYRAHYPAAYIAAHRPILGLTIDRLSPASWARTARQPDPGPYFITHASFVPTFKVLAHEDQPQVPTNVLRLNFSTTTATYGAIAPRGIFSDDSPQMQGFTIAKQNCLRCHNEGPYGGTKSDCSWAVLSTWASKRPASFEKYVRDPKSFDLHSKMPANPGYDAATLAALTAYFKTFTAPPDTAGH